MNKEVIIIRTSHVAKNSAKEIKNTIKTQKPEIIAIELDRARYEALTRKEETKPNLKIIKKIGIKGAGFLIIGRLIQKTIAKKLKVEPGIDMLTAIETAKKEKIRIALIDQNIEKTLKKLNKELTKKEIIKIVIDIIKTPFSKEKKRIDLTKTPDEKIVEEAIKELKKRYPGMYKALVKDRNEILAKNIKKLTTAYDKIVAVVGAGHAKEIKKILEKEKIKATIQN